LNLSYKDDLNNDLYHKCFNNYKYLVNLMMACRLAPYWQLLSFYKSSQQLLSSHSPTKKAR